MDSLDKSRADKGILFALLHTFHLDKNDYNYTFTYCFDEDYLLSLREKNTI